MAFSPVPSHTTSQPDIEHPSSWMSPTASDSMKSLIGSHCVFALPVTECHTPPDAAPIQTSLRLNGLTATFEARPVQLFTAMGAGPTGNQAVPAISSSVRWPYPIRSVNERDCS